VTSILKVATLNVDSTFGEVGVIFPDVMFVAIIINLSNLPFVIPTLSSLLIARCATVSDNCKLDESRLIFTAK